MTIPQTIGFLGAGQMARALAGGMVAAGLVDPARVVASDPSPEAREAFARAVTGAAVEVDNGAVVRSADVVFLAVKPQHLDAALAAIGEQAAGRLFVSIVAGAPIAGIAARLGVDRIVRVMPNTPALVGCCAAAHARGPGATDDDDALVGRLLSAVGVSLPVEERLLDAVTGLSGSGPAFAFVFLEALADGGVRMGLPRAAAQTLAAQTMLGAARMVLETGEHPAVLKDRVASPGGTTIAGLAALEHAGLRSAAISAVEAATRRCRELGDERPSGGG